MMRWESLLNWVCEDICSSQLLRITDRTPNPCMNTYICVTYHIKQLGLHDLIFYFFGWLVVGRADPSVQWLSCVKCSHSRVNWRLCLSRNVLIWTVKLTTLLLLRYDFCLVLYSTITPTNLLPGSLIYFL